MDNLKTLGKDISIGFEKNERLIKIAVTVIAIVAALFFFGENGEKDQVKIIEESPIVIGETVHEESPEEEIIITEQRSITVDISGEILNPGVYTLEENARLNDLIEKAGGLRDSADINAINRAGFLSDGMKIYIPSIEENEPVNKDEGIGWGRKESSPSSGKININKGDSNELQKIPGIGPVMSERIVEYRDKNGGFKSIEELKNVSGIGDKTFEKIKDYITI